MQAADAIDCAALAAGADISKGTARSDLDDRLCAPVGPIADGFEALRRTLGSR